MFLPSLDGSKLHHHAQLFLFRWGLKTFLPGLAWNLNPP
jgi:hypothetical protein